MSMNPEITIRKDRLISSEAVRIFLAFMFLFLIQVSFVEAGDDDLDKSNETSISLSLDIESTIDQANAQAQTDDVEQQGTPEAQTEETLSMIIDSGTRVRRVSDGEVNEFYRRGNGVREVDGWFNSEDTDFEDHARGIWLIFDDGEYAVFAPLVTESAPGTDDDNTPISAAEAATTREWRINQGSGELAPFGPEPTPTEPPDDEDDEPLPVPVPEPRETETPADQDITTPEPSGTPEALVVPEYPDNIDIRVIRGTPLNGEWETINVDLIDENILPIPPGIVEIGQFEDVDAFLNQIENTWLANGDRFVQGAANVRLIETNLDERSQRWSLVVGIPSNDSSWVAFRLTTSNESGFFMMPVDSNMESMDQEGEFFRFNPETRITADGIITDRGLIPIGGNFIATFFDPTPDMQGDTARMTTVGCSQLTPTPALEYMAEGETCRYGRDQEAEGMLNTPLGGIIYLGE